MDTMHLSKFTQNATQVLQVVVAGAFVCAFFHIGSTITSPYMFAPLAVLEISTFLYGQAIISIGHLIDHGDGVETDDDYRVYVRRNWIRFLKYLVAVAATIVVTLVVTL